VFSPEQMATIHELHPEVRSRRGQANVAYTVSATLALGDDSAFRWLYDPTTGHMRAEILAELGQLRDPDAIRTVARWLCTDRPRAKDAIVQIRGTRRQTLPPPDTKALATAILDTILTYRGQHLGTDMQHIDQAMGLIMEALIARLCPHNGRETA